VAFAALAACGGGAERAPAFDAGIDGAYVVQSTQDYAGTVPLVQGRAGLLRVFLRSDRPDIPAPAVRARLYDAAGALIQTYEVTAQPPPATLPTAVSEESLGGSWNFAIPAADLQPGRHLVAELDPVAGIPAARTRATFRYPASGSLDVREVPTLSITLVPVVQAPAGSPPLAPLVSGAEPGGGTRSVDSWLDLARRMHPLLTVEVLLAATYTTDIALGPDGTGWASLLSELEQKRLVDGSPGSYLGAVHVSYTEGTNGIAYVSPALPSSALAWDAGATPGDPSYQRVVAHEVGHNLGLMHAPCGSPMPAGLDPGWPTGPSYAGAHIGVFGLDPLDGTVKSPTSDFDVMSYCGTVASTWTSDHDYRRILGFLTGAPATAAAGPRILAASEPSAVRQPCLVVAGRVAEGGVDLRPAYVVDTIPSPSPPGEYALDLLDGKGDRLASFPFAPTVVPAEREGEAEESHFALALPVTARAIDGLRGLAVRRRGVEIFRRVVGGSSAATEPGSPVGVAVSRGHAYLRWDALVHPGAMVRDARSGEVLAFLHGGTGMVRTDAPAIEVVLSDGVRSRRGLLVAP
jgi:hypothetical protein